jgi:hypothetical protein
MSFQEKSLWLTLFGLLVAFGVYFWLLWQMVGAGVVASDVLPAQVGLLVATTILLVVVLITGHIAIAIVDRRTETDERDRLIACTGERYGGFVLATGVFLALCTAVMTDGNAAMALVLLGFWVLAQAVEIGTQLVLYRRSA